MVVDGRVVFQSRADSLTEWLDVLYDNLALNYPKFHRMDPLSKLGLLAAETVLPRPVTAPESVAVVLSNRHSSLDTDLRYEAARKNAPSPALFVYTLPNIVTGEIAIRHGLKGENAFFVARDFDAAMLTDYVDQLMAEPFTTACLAGWVDVLAEHHDVLLYLVEKEPGPVSWAHSVNQLNLFYQN